MSDTAYRACLRVYLGDPERNLLEVKKLLSSDFKKELESKISLKSLSTSRM